MAILFLDFLKRSGKQKLLDMIQLSRDATSSDGIVVFFDDGAYSGEQLSGDYLKRFLWNVERSLVIVGVPFMTMDAIEKIQSALEVHAHRIASMILYSDIMESAANTLGATNNKLRLYKPAVYFDHKIPDRWSTYPIYSEYINARPLYKNWEVPPSHIEPNARFNFSKYKNAIKRLPAPFSVSVDHNPSN
jgi:hypothetical protein